MSRDACSPRETLRRPMCVGERQADRQPYSASRAASFGGISAQQPNSGSSPLGALIYGISRHFRFLGPVGFSEAGFAKSDSQSSLDRSYLPSDIGDGRMYVQVRGRADRSVPEQKLELVEVEARAPPVGRIRVPGRVGLEITHAGCLDAAFVPALERGLSDRTGAVDFPPAGA